MQILLGTRCRNYSFAMSGTNDKEIEPVDANSSGKRQRNEDEEGMRWSTYTCNDALV